MEIIATINNLAQVWFANQAWIPVENLIRRGWNLNWIHNTYNERDDSEMRVVISKDDFDEEVDLDLTMYEGIR